MSLKKSIAADLRPATAFDPCLRRLPRPAVRGELRLLCALRSPARDATVHLLEEHGIELHVDSPLAKRVGRRESEIISVHEGQQLAQRRAAVILELGQDLLDLGAVEHLGQTGHRLDGVMRRDVVGIGLAEPAR